jgi:hypothetical protein
MKEDDLDRVYEGRAKVNSPIMKWKVKGIVSRIMKILFNVLPIGRIEAQKGQDVKKGIEDIWNKYIFKKQLDEISFKEQYRLFQKNKAIEGTAVAKITQEYEVKEIQFFDDEPPREYVIKDNTYFRPILLEEFYSDANKYSCQDSQACIHSTTMSMEELRANEKRKETEVYDIINTETGEVIGQEEEVKEVGLYHNLDLLQCANNGVTEQQQEYMELLGFTRTWQKAFQKGLVEAKKSGFVKIDECYGRYHMDGEDKEVVCTIANGSIVIRLEETPFRHRRYVRPFIVGKYDPIPNCLYGESNVIAGLNLLQELNAARAQARDANTQSVFPMTYVDTQKNVKWDYMWRPNGVIMGQGSNGITPIINPSLSNVTINDSIVIQRDIDQLWSLSPVQEGTSDRSKIPATARGTLAVIQQNDMPLNDLIDSATEEEIKPFIEMLFERDLLFKDVEDLLSVATEQELVQAGITSDMRLADMFFDFDTKILGTLELSNEVAHQQGYINFLNFAQSVPPIAKRLDWPVVAEKMLKSFGIKDDADGIFLDPQLVAEADQRIQQQQAQDQQQAVAQETFKRKSEMVEEIDKHRAEAKIDLEKDIAKMQTEVILESATGQKVQ